MANNLIRQMGQVLARLSRGNFAHEMDEHLSQALEALEALPGEKGKAEITIKLSIACDKGRIDVKPSIKSKLPDGQQFAASPFWVVDGALSTQHPDQVDLWPQGKAGVGVEPESDTGTG